MKLYLSEVLKLEMTSSSIKKIDVFLSKLDRKDETYYKAFAYRNLIGHHLGKTAEALKNLYQVAADFTKLKPESIITICDAIIEINLDIKRFDQARKYIDIKKKYLQVSNSNLNLIDEIKYAKATKEYQKAIAYLKSYQKEELNPTANIWAMEELTKIYYELKDYDNYLLIAPKLAKTYQDGLNINAYIKVCYNLLSIEYERGNFLKVISEGNLLLNNYKLDDENTILIVTLLILSYLKSGDFRKAGVFESNYVGKLEQVMPNTAIAFAEAALQLYERIHSPVSIKYYQDLISKQKSTIAKKNKSPKRNVDIVDHELEDDIVVADKETSYQIKPKAVSNIYVSETFIKLSEVFKALNNLANNSKFREVFRIALINLANVVHFDEAYLLYFDHSYLGLHYKKERAYDKRLEVSALDDTINFMAILKEEPIILDATSTEGLKNIVTNQSYELPPFAIALPMVKDGTAYASLAFMGEKDFIREDMAYEILIIITDLLNNSLQAFLRQSDLYSENRKMFFIYENMPAGVKEEMDEQIHLSRRAIEILGCSEDLTASEYRSHIQSSDLAAYDLLVKEVKQYLTLNKSLEYHFKKDDTYIPIKETFYCSYENGCILLYSLIEDISNQAKKQQELLKLAYNNPKSNLPSEISLIVDLKNNLDHNKITVGMIEVNDFKLYEELYGLNFTSQLIKAIGSELKEVTSKDFNVKIYHLEAASYAIIIKDTNDRRTVDNYLLKIFNATSKQITSINHRVKINFNCGVYRVSKTVNLNDPNKVIANAYEGLTDARNLKTKEHHICHYDGELAKRRFNENQLITHISEAIDFGRIGVSYRQVVDIDKKEIFAYYATISLDNYEVEAEEMWKVIRRRNLEEMITKYLITTASKELKQLSLEAKASVYVFIDVPNAAMVANFIDFIETQNQFFKTTKSECVLVVEKAKQKKCQELKALGYLIASADLYDLYTNSIDFLIYDVLVYGFEILPEILKLCENKNVNFILKGANSKSDIEKSMELGVKNLFGDYYHRQVRMKKLIEKLT